MAIQYTISLFGQENHSSLNPSITKIFQENGWLSAEQTVLDLLKEGYDNFELKVAERVLVQHPENVFLNNCPECGGLARTPLAKQCRHCFHRW